MIFLSEQSLAPVVRRVNYWNQYPKSVSRSDGILCFLVYVDVQYGRHALCITHRFGNIPGYEH